MKLSSLELNWLSKKDKYLPIPEVVFVDSFYAGGCYFHPDRCQVLIGDKFINCDKGIIIVNTEYAEKDSELMYSNNWIPSCLAHEWRHHWQYYNVDDEKDYINWSFEGYDTDEYWESIFSFFEKSNKELDALKFQHNIYPTEYSGYCSKSIKERNK